MGNSRCPRRDKTTPSTYVTKTNTKGVVVEEEVAEVAEVVTEAAEADVDADVEANEAIEAPRKAVVNFETVPPVEENTDITQSVRKNADTVASRDIWRHRVTGKQES